MSTQSWQKIKEVFQEAIELPPTDRAAFLDVAAGSNGEFRAEIESLLSAHEEAGEFISEPALVEAGLAGNDRGRDETSLNGTRIGPYEIVRELGRGGMATVFLARRADEQFEKQVALKIIKRGMDTDSILRRFMIERQILANLEHPHIARFLDGGTTADGLPYFVMEYIEGEPLTKYCEAQQLNTNERLELFRKVCAAVQYAHQNLIVHRDLKPSNILVTPDGTPKLLDFGISKLLNSDWAGTATEETASALRLMTPEYASPEQLRGLTITTATDVYSLGIVLYELLSGQRPFRFPSRLPEDIVRVLLTEEPERPSTATRRAATSRTGDESGPLSTDRVSRSLRGDLDNIVLKAMRKDRERRYASVQEFSEDIRRHLNGLPVSARPDTWAYRAGKFVKRHQAAVATASLIIVTLLSAIVVTSWQAHVARRERAKAERRFAEQRKLADSLINEVQTSLKEVPHTIPTQRLLAQKSLEYLNNLARDAGDDPSFLSDLAAAYINVGYLQSWTLQDNPNALLTYQRGIDLLRRRAALEPNSTAAKHQLSNSLSNRIEALTLMNRLEEAVATYSEKLGIEEELLAATPQDSAQMMNVAEINEGYGEALVGLKRINEANAKFQIAVDLATQAINLFTPQAQQPQQRVDLSLYQEKLGSIFEQLNQLQRAEESYRAAAGVAEEVHRAHPEIIQALRNTTSSHWYLGLILDRQRDHEQALENYRVSLKAIMDAIATDRNMDPSQYGESKYSIVVGRELCRIGQKTEGVPLIHHGLEILHNYEASEKGNTRVSFYGSELMTWAVEGLEFAGQTDEAANLSQEAIKLVDESTHLSDDPNPRLRLAGWYELLGDVYASYDKENRKIQTADSKRLSDARQAYQKGLDVLQDTVKLSVSMASLEDESAAFQEKIAACDARLGR